MGVHEATLTKKDVASTRIGPIVVSLLVFFICETYFSPVGGGSPYLSAAIVRIRNLFGTGTHSHEQSVTSLASLGEFLPSSIPRLFLTDFCKVLGSVCFSLLFLYLWVAKACLHLQCTV